MGLYGIENAFALLGRDVHMPVAWLNQSEGPVLTSYIGFVTCVSSIYMLLCMGWLVLASVLYFWIVFPLMCCAESVSSRLCAWVMELQERRALQQGEYRHADIRSGLR